MNILVTGGAGFIGSSIVDGLLQRGHTVAVLDNLSTGRQSNINRDSKFFHVDIRDTGAVRSAIGEFRPQVVIHQAAQMDVRVSTRVPQEDAHSNIIGTVNLLAACREFGVEKVIYASTGGAVYGEPQHTPVTESHSINLLSQYGISKHTVEHYLYLYNQNYGLNYTSLRYPNVYGPRQNPHGEAGVLAIFSKKICLGEVPVIFGDGSQERDYVYMSDVWKPILRP